MIVRRIGGLIGGASLLCAHAAGAVQDPGVPGPHAVSVTSYGSFGTSVSLGEIQTVEELGQVHYPTDIANGPYPLVVLLHGRHATCYTVATGQASLRWPCGAGQSPIPSYQGYDYLASVLASQGMIVASISANGINAVDNGTSTFGMNERALLMQHHLDLWNTFNTTGGAFGSLFVGHVDLGRVGTMGHSRGGEGVVWHYEHNLSLGAPYGIRAVLPLAPVNFFGHFVNDVPLGVLLPYCDGDVYNLPGVGYFDDARYSASGDQTPKYTVLGLGANHNYFNRIWTPGEFNPGSSDDWSLQDGSQTDPFCGTAAPGNGRLTPAQQRGFGTAYMSAFFRRHLLGEKEFDAILDRDAPPPASAQTSAAYTAYLPGASDRKDVNRLISSSELTTNTLGASITTTSLVGYGLCGGFTGVSCIGGSGREPHFPSLSTAEIGWTSSSAAYSNAVPVLQGDISNFATLQFRAAVDYSDAKNVVGQAQNLSIRLTDRRGFTATVQLADFSGILYYPPAADFRRATVLNTVRVPLSAFSSVDITTIGSITLVLDRSASGAVFVSDFALSDEGLSVAEKWLASMD